MESFFLLECFKASTDNYFYTLNALQLRGWLLGDPNTKGSNPCAQYRPAHCIFCELTRLAVYLRMDVQWCVFSMRYMVLPRNLQQNEHSTSGHWSMRECCVGVEQRDQWDGKYMDCQAAVSCFGAHDAFPMSMVSTRATANHLFSQV